MGSVVLVPGREVAVVHDVDGRVDRQECILERVDDDVVVLRPVGDVEIPRPGHAVTLEVAEGEQYQSLATTVAMRPEVGRLVLVRPAALDWADRRANPRVRAGFDAAWGPAGGACEFDAHIVDVSLGGARLAIDTVFAPEVGDLLELEVPLGDALLRAIGEVRWRSDDARGTVDCSVQWQTIRDGWDALGTYVERRLDEEVARPS